MELLLQVPFGRWQWLWLYPDGGVKKFLEDGDEIPFFCYRLKSFVSRLEVSCVKTIRVVRIEGFSYSVSG